MDKLHNKFEIHIDDNGSKSVLTVYNVVLDRTASQIKNYNIYSKICLGTGTGEISSSRTSMFSYHSAYSTKAYTDVNYNYETKSAERTWSIYLDENTANGVTFTEIGFGASNSNMFTHALFTDSNGLPTSITKTDTMKLTIYATLYVSWDVSSYKDTTYAYLINTCETILGDTRFNGRTYALINMNDAAIAPAYYSPTTRSTTFTLTTGDLNNSAIYNIAIKNYLDNYNSNQGWASLTAFKADTEQFPANYVTGHPLATCNGSDTTFYPMVSISPTKSHSIKKGKNFTLYKNGTKVQETEYTIEYAITSQIPLLDTVTGTSYSSYTSGGSLGVYDDKIAVCIPDINYQNIIDVCEFDPDIDVHISNRNVLFSFDISSTEIYKSYGNRYYAIRFINNGAAVVIIMSSGSYSSSSEAHVYLFDKETKTIGNKIWYGTNNSYTITLNGGKGPYFNNGYYTYFIKGNSTVANGYSTPYMNGLYLSDGTLYNINNEGTEEAVSSSTSYASIGFLDAQDDIMYLAAIPKSLTSNTISVVIKNLTTNAVTIEDYTIPNMSNYTVATSQDDYSSCISGIPLSKDASSTQIYYGVVDHAKKEIVIVPSTTRNYTIYAASSMCNNKATFNGRELMERHEVISKIVFNEPPAAEDVLTFDADLHYFRKTSDWKFDFSYTESTVGN